MSDVLDDERMRILQMIERGEINAAEAMHRLDELGTGSSMDPEQWTANPALATPSRFDHPDIEHWKRWWMIPFWAGAGIMLITALLMLSALQASGAGFWFYCAMLPLLMGVAIMALAWASRSSRWLHVRINTGQDKWPRRIAISLPVPVRLAAWLLRILTPRVPALRARFGDTALDELILALDETAAAATPFYVDVSEDEEGERVQVYFG